MTLKQFLSTLHTANINVTIVDLDTNEEIATLKASGYACLDDTIEQREVKQWAILSQSAIKAVIGAVVEENTADDTPNTDPENNG